MELKILESSFFIQFDVYLVLNQFNEHFVCTSINHNIHFYNLANDKLIN